MSASKGFTLSIAAGLIAWSLLAPTACSADQVFLFHNDNDGDATLQYGDLYVALWAIDAGGFCDLNQFCQVNKTPQSATMFTSGNFNGLTYDWYVGTIEYVVQSQAFTLDDPLNLVGTFHYTVDFYSDQPSSGTVFTQSLLFSLDGTVQVAGNVHPLDITLGSVQFYDITLHNWPADTDSASVPEPATLVLLGTGLLSTWATAIGRKRLG